MVAIVKEDSKSQSTAIYYIKRQITLLQEFRICLISDVVTGKLDVRKAASRLPVATEEIEQDIETVDSMEEEFQESETTGEAYG
jgi:type I restriction enzyme S subunit